MAGFINDTAIVQGTVEVHYYIAYGAKTVPKLETPIECRREANAPSNSAGNFIFTAVPSGEYLILPFKPLSSEFVDGRVPDSFFASASLTKHFNTQLPEYLDKYIT